MKLKVLSWKEIKTAGEKKLESELRRISRIYADRARTLEKSIGTEMFELAYGKRLTAKQIRDTLINESDGRFKFRKAYQRWTNKGNMNIYKKLDYETKTELAKIRYPGLDIKRGLDLVRREDIVVGKINEFLSKDYDLETDVDGEMSDIIREILEADPTTFSTNLASELHNYENRREGEVVFLEKLAEKLGIKI